MRVVLTQSGEISLPQGPGWASTQIVAALVLPLGAVLMDRGAAPLSVLAALTVICLLWEALFALIRHRHISLHGLTTALIIAVMVPHTVPVWQLAVAASIGVVLGELVFGGRGFGFVNAAAVSLAALVFSFPQVALAPASETLVIATLPGAILLLYAGLLAWQSAAAFGAVLVALSLAGFAPDVPALAPVLFALVFLLADPLAGAITPLGRALQGAVAAVLAVSIGPALPPEALVFAAVLAAVFAPLLDFIATEVHRLRRASRHAP